ncbi:very short patch repair endonuclease [Paraburkholderia fungorum]|uniref:very short patch repair endonuclease n=1 Tax=Paraburkholderia fungorum TaxID=134537 RepID=UPI001C1EADA1|nr:very short patch repair endonuclease [Paraburkholderia fungorum]MBU7438595.1 very short patch repair endonuclease [Paraburkholderia fungorum]
MDKVTQSTRSRMMAAVRSRDTAPELRVRSMLHAAGLRFRLHDRSLPGTPDIVLKKHATVIMVNGCFWHGHRCPKGKLPATRINFWSEKQQTNRRRDAEAIRRLRTSGWRVLVIWECQTRRKEELAQALARSFPQLLRSEADLPCHDK